MPAHTFTGPNEGQYPGERDLAGQPLGMVGPGDIRDLEGPLDHQWRETTGEDREALAARLAAAEAKKDGGAEARVVEHPADGTLSPPVENPATPAAAPPAVPAAVPAASAPAIAGPAGTTPQEG